MTHRIRTALALAVTSLPLAAPAIASPSASAAGLALPWGDWLAGLLQPVTAALVPLAAAAVTAGIARVAPWAASVLTRDRIEAAIRAGAEFGQNAVAGGHHRGARHVLATAPAHVVRKAGGPAGVAARIFRTLPLDPEASAANVLAPALAQLRGADTRPA